MRLFINSIYMVPYPYIKYVIETPVSYVINICKRCYWKWEIKIGNHCNISR